MEVGDILFEKFKKSIQSRDLDIKVSAGFVVSATLKTLIFLREELGKRLGKGMIYFTTSGQPLYLVHWNDLCERKRLEIEGKKIRK